MTLVQLQRAAGRVDADAAARLEALYDWLAEKGNTPDLSSARNMLASLGEDIG